MKNKKMTAWMAIDYVETVEVVLVCLLGTAVSIGVFAMSFALTSALFISLGLAVVAGLYSGRRALLWAAREALRSQESYR